MNLGCALPYIMNLPIDGAQRQEIIASIGFDRWQAHAGVDFAGFAFAQEATTVIDVELRQHF